MMLLSFVGPAVCNLPLVLSLPQVNRFDKTSAFWAARITPLKAGIGGRDTSVQGQECSLIMHRK